jgi:hypothetical protein
MWHSVYMTGLTAQIVIWKLCFITQKFSFIKMSEDKRKGEVNLLML